VWNRLDLHPIPGEDGSVSALPKEAEPAAPSDDEGWALLEGLRRRLDDQAGQVRRTQQQVSQLAESIATLVSVQRKRVRWLNLNSFVAYVIFTVLCGGGFYALYRSRVDEQASARVRADSERDAAVKRADDATGKLGARDAADQRAWEVYQLLESGKRADATAKLGAASNLPLSRTERAVLAAKVHETQVMEVEAAIKAAAAAMKAGRTNDVIAPLEAALVGEPAGARAATMHYYLGVAYAKAGTFDKAIANIETALSGDVDQEDARFQLASALDRSGAWGKARTEYDRFATAHPQSQLAPFAMRRSATLARMPAVQPPPGQPIAPRPAAPAPPPKPPEPATGSAAPTPIANPFDDTDPKP